VTARRRKPQSFGILVVFASRGFPRWQHAKAKQAISSLSATRSSSFNVSLLTQAAIPDGGLESIFADFIELFAPSGQHFTARGTLAILKRNP
jgi:hypothetical protein